MACSTTTSEGSIHPTSCKPVKYRRLELDNALLSALGLSKLRVLTEGSKKLTTQPVDSQDGFDLSFSTSLESVAAAARLPDLLLKVC